MIEERRPIRPIVTWVGGKVRVLDRLLPLMPRTFSAYHEPFCGSASAFLAMNLSGKRVFLNDSNAAVYALFRSLKSVADARALNTHLARYQKQYDAACKVGGREGGRQMYEAVREVFNRAKRDNAITDTSPVKLAAALVFLNRTAYGSVYRENAEGSMNVTYGPSHQRLTVAIHRPHLVDALHAYMARNDMRLSCKDFSAALRAARRDDFVFMDPPYWPVHTRQFTSYQSHGFAEEAQLRVRQALDELTQKGCHVMLLNSDSPQVRSLYRGYKLTRLPVPTGIAGRTRHDLVILNYSPSCKSQGSQTPASTAHTGRAATGACQRCSGTQGAGRRL